MRFLPLLTTLESLSTVEVATLSPVLFARVSSSVRRVRFGSPRSLARPTSPHEPTPVPEWPPEQDEWPGRLFGRKGAGVAGIDRTGVGGAPRALRRRSPRGEEVARPESCLSTPLCSPRQHSSSRRRRERRARERERAVPALRSACRQTFSFSERKGAGVVVVSEASRRAFGVSDMRPGRAAPSHLGGLVHAVAVLSPPVLGPWLQPGCIAHLGHHQYHHHPHHRQQFRDQRFR